MIATFLKQEREKEFIGIDFSARVRAGATMQFAEVCSSIYQLNAQVNTTDLTLEQISFDPLTNIVYVLVGGGTQGIDYHVTFLALLSNDEAKEEDIAIKIRNR